MDETEFQPGAQVLESAPAAREVSDDVQLAIKDVDLEAVSIIYKTSHHVCPTQCGADPFPGIVGKRHCVVLAKPRLSREEPDTS
jgi:hypothetical protein